MGLNQKLAGQVEPDSESWRSAKAADRLAFYKHAGDLAVEIKRGELARGIGANGRRMKARKHPRPDGASGPVMTPHDDRSRTSRLLAPKATANGVTLFWHAGIRKGQKTAWGTILGFHAAGAGHLPIRDVRLSKRGIGALRKAMEAWWEQRQRAKAAKARETAPPKPGFFGRIKEAAKSALGKLKAAFGRKAPSNATPSQSDMINRYPGLKPYLRDKGGNPIK